MVQKKQTAYIGTHRAARKPVGLSFASDTLLVTQRHEHKVFKPAPL